MNIKVIFNIVEKEGNKAKAIDDVVDETITFQSEVNARIAANDEYYVDEAKLSKRQYIQELTEENARIAANDEYHLDDSKLSTRQYIQEKTDNLVKARQQLKIEVNDLEQLQRQALVDKRLIDIVISRESSVEQLRFAIEWEEVELKKAKQFLARMELDELR